MPDDDRPVLDQINLVVRDMDASLEFYRRAGLDAMPTVAPWDRHHRNLPSPDGFDFDIDSSTFAQKWNTGWPAGASGPVLGFRVLSRASVDRIYADLTGAGYAGQQVPYDTFWGARYAVVSDPDGNAVGFMSPSDPDRRFDPPDPE